MQLIQLLWGGMMSQITRNLELMYYNDVPPEVAGTAGLLGRLWQGVWGSIIKGGGIW